MVSSEINNNPHLDAEIASLKQELLDSTTTNERLEEIHARALELGGFNQGDPQEPSTSLQTMTNDELTALLTDPSTPPEVLNEIKSLAEARNPAAETLPTEEQ